MANEPRFEVYPRHTAHGRDGGEEDVPTGEFGWRFRATNGQISAVSGEGFTRREDARRAVADFSRAVLAGWGTAPIDVPWEGPPILDIDE